MAWHAVNVINGSGWRKSRCTMRELLGVEVDRMDDDDDAPEDPMAELIYQQSHERAVAARRARTNGSA